MTQNKDNTNNDSNSNSPSENLSLTEQILGLNNPSTTITKLKTNIPDIEIEEVKEVGEPKTIEFSHEEDKNTDIKSDKHSEYIAQSKKNKTKILSEEIEETPLSIVQEYYQNKGNNTSENGSYYIDPNASDKSKGLFGSLIVSILSLFKFSFDIIQVVVIAFAIFIVFYLFIVSPHTIDGKSMQPNFCNGDLILADKITPNFRPYQNGDVIVFVSNEGSDYIKRIVGKEGDRVKVQGGKVYRNDKLLEEPYLNPSVATTLLSSVGMQEGVYYEVPKGKFLVFGDNRPGSTDSRKFLAIDPNGQNKIKGKVRVILWPPEHARIFNDYEAQPADFCLL